ncbi:Uncharacterized protein Rs2_16985 [Raphanus sativus]|nr:Uncharacterized protein Rs2_16985 [Raphanus sativus]
MIEEASRVASARVVKRIQHKLDLAGNEEDIEKYSKRLVAMQETSRTLRTRFVSSLKRLSLKPQFRVLDMLFRGELDIGRRQRKRTTAQICLTGLRHGYYMELDRGR